MSGLSTINLIFGAIPVIKNKVYYEAIRTNLILPSRAYINRRFGRFPRFLYYLCIFDAEGIQKLHYNINLWSDEELRSWRDSYIASCNAIAVAGAIFASIGQTGLQLPNITQIHWTVRAFFCASMLLGILSVVTATSQHRNLGIINDPIALRVWLSKGGPGPIHSVGSEAYPEPYDALPLESSVSAALVTQFPHLLLNLAVFLYLVGFGLYLLFSWKQQVPDASNDYRNILIVFVILVGLFIVYYTVLYVCRVTDAATVSQQFKFQRLGTSDEVKELKKNLEFAEKYEVGEHRAPAG